MLYNIPAIRLNFSTCQLHVGMLSTCALHLVDTNFLNMSARQKMDLSECVYAFLTHRADKKIWIGMIFLLFNIDADRHGIQAKSVPL